MSDNKGRMLAKENRECYVWCRDNGHLQFISLATQCDAFARGEQWDPKTVARLQRRKKPNLTINKVLATYSALKGEQITRGGDVSFRASAGGDPATARIIDKLWLNFSQTNNREWQEGELFRDGVIRSRGFLDLRINFDETMRGEPELTYLNSKDVGLFPGDSGYDPDNWSGVMLTRWLSARDISEIYGMDLDDILSFADTPELDSDYLDWRKDAFGTAVYEHQLFTREQRAKRRLLRVLERQEWEYRNANCFVDVATGEVREVPSTWDNERIRMAIAQYGYNVIRRRMKKIHWVVTVGDICLHAAISPYKHFTPIPYFPFLIGSKPVGIVEQLRDPQNLLNKTLSQELHIVAGIANSGFKVGRGSLANMTPEQLQDRGGEDGIVIEINGDLNQVEKLVPNQVPTGLDRLSYTAAEAIQQISLVNDSMQGLNRSDEAGKAIERKAMQGSSALAPVFNSLDQSRRIIARNWLDLVQQFVTEERVYHVTNKASRAKTEEITVNQEQFDGSFLNDLTVGEYMIQVTDVQSRDSFEQNQFDILVQLIRLGAPIPWSDVISSLSIIENRDDIVEYLKTQEGRTDPSEAQKIKEQLDQRLLEAQAADKEASAAVKQAQAMKAQMESDPNAKNADRQFEMAKSQQDMMMKSQTQREAHDLKQQGAQTKMMIDQQTAMAKLEIERQNSQNKLAVEQQKAQIDVALAREKLQYERQRQAEEMQFLREKNAIELEKLRATLQSNAMQAQLQHQSAVAQNEIAHENTVRQNDLAHENTIRQNELAAERAKAQNKPSPKQPETDK